jgi:hypothetical protein
VLSCVCCVLVFRHFRGAQGPAISPIPGTAVPTESTSE